MLRNRGSYPDCVRLFDIVGTVGSWLSGVLILDNSSATCQLNSEQEHIQLDKMGYMLIRADPLDIGWLNHIPNYAAKVVSYIRRYVFYFRRTRTLREYFDFTCNA